MLLKYFESVGADIVQWKSNSSLIRLIQSAVYTVKLINSFCWHQIESCDSMYKDSLLWRNFCFDVSCQQKLVIILMGHPVWRRLQSEKNDIRSSPMTMIWCVIKLVCSEYLSHFFVEKYKTDFNFCLPKIYLGSMSCLSRLEVTRGWHIFPGTFSGMGSNGVTVTKFLSYSWFWNCIWN